MEYQYTFIVHGFIWIGDDKPIQLSGVFKEFPDKPVYMSADNITGAIRRKAAERGVSMGVIVDELNAAIPQPEPIAEWRFDNLSEEQFNYLKGLFPPADDNDFRKG